MTERWSEYGGQRDANYPETYDAAILRDCPSCGAEAGMLCTGKVVTDRKTKETVTFERRHMPCVKRLKLVRN